ncbi:hypothetical protein [Nocardioides baculatus]|uniref:Carboxypeptidase regulatory-like domain-containing protein n=1 Tax=Nocardioides baculatus TaxID=2801337 RepID=A0ABS1L6Z4_9ACTN|nr:hypothetical protein [Nocardioides baculatus]MBL0747380.1 hypothetical protein [Nocardioides baculatus]
MTDGDAGADVALLEELRTMWVTYDPPPPGLTAAMIAVVAAADLDEEWELLTLVSDSAHEPAAQVRGLSTARVLYFNAAAGWSLEAEIDGNDVKGQLLDHPGDPGSVEIALENRDGASWTTEVDEVGFFALEAEAVGSVRFVVTIDGRIARSRWLDV